MYSGKPYGSNTSSSGKKARAEFKSLAKKNKKEDWEIFFQFSQQQYTYESSLEQSKTVERQRHKKKMNVLEVNEALYKYSKSIANKISDTPVELYFPRNYDPNFLELKQKEERKNIHLNHANKGNFIEPFSKEEFTVAI